MCPVKRMSPDRDSAPVPALGGLENGVLTKL
jgi:hypothetical protein